jgi:hypothetical protein
MNYGTLIDNRLHLAPCAFMLRGAMVTNPKAEHFAALNEERAKQGLPPYLPVRDERPSADAEHYAVATGWTRDGETWRRVYEVREVPPPPPRTFSKYKLVGALMQAQVWPQVKEWIESVPGAYDLYLAAEDISEDEPLLAQGIAAVKQLLGWTDEQVEEVLAASVKEGS